MTIERNLKISLDRFNVLGRIGLSDQRPVNGQILEMVNRTIDEYLKLNILHPFVQYKINAITCVKNGRIYFGRDTYLTSESIASLYPKVKAIAAAIFTIGDELEKKVTVLCGSGEQLRGVVLDGIGNAALDALAEETCQIIKAKAASLGYVSGSPLSPGMPGISLSEQHILFKLLHPTKGDISLTAQNFMVPAKSLSMVICIGYDVPTWSKPEMCNRCTLRRTCRFKISPR